MNESLPVKLVAAVVARVDQLLPLVCLCTLYVEAPETEFQEKETVPPLVGLVSEDIIIVGAAQLVGVGDGVGVGVAVGVGVGIGVGPSLVTLAYASIRPNVEPASTFALAVCTMRLTTALLPLL